MAAVLRVKRKKDEEPLDALLIACKRQKTAQEAEKVSEPLTATFKFAGTVKNQVRSLELSVSLFSITF